MEMNNTQIEQMDDGLDLRYIFSIFLHWWWVILLATILAGFVSFFVSSKITPIYQSSTSVFVNEAPGNKSADYNSVLMSKQLTSTYSQMMVNDTVLNQVVEQVGISNTLEEIKKWISVETIRDTQLIKVTVETTDPNLSANIANSIVTAFSYQIQEIQGQRF